MKARNIGKIVSIIVVIVILGFILIPGSLHIIDTGEIAVVRHLGKITKVRNPGLYFDLWLTNDYQIYDTKVQQVEVNTPAYSSDGQTLALQVMIQYQIKTAEVVNIATIYGDLTKLESRIETVAIERLKSVVSEKTAMGIIGTRNVVSKDVTARIEEAVGDDYFVNINSVVLTNIDFTDEFEKIIEDKVAAEQEAQKAVNEAAKKEAEAEGAKKVAQLEAEAALYKAEKEAEAILAKAKAEAEALQLQNSAVSDVINAYKDELGITTEKAIELYKYKLWVETWDGDVPMVTGDTDCYIGLPEEK